MINRLIVICITLVCCQVYAQQGSTSPYSFYGIGSLKFKGTVENMAMGGIGSYIDSLHINLKNPASFSGKNIEASPYNGESRPVKFSVAGTFTNTQLNSNTETQNASTTTFDYIAVSIPLGRFGAGFGLLPFTSVGYQLQDINAVEDRIDYRYEGEGGLNKVFFSLAYAITDEFSFGVDANYNFGNIQNSALRFRYDDDGDLLQFQTRQNNRSDLSGLNFNFGAAYKTNITDKLELSATATFAPESDLGSINERSVSTVFINAFGDEFLQDTIDDDEFQSSGLAETDLSLPSLLSLGFGIGQVSKWFIGAEYLAQNTSVFNNPLLDGINTNRDFEDASSFAIGGFYLPEYNSFSNFFKRVTYRAGTRFENTGLIINGESINEFGISFGLGLPLRTSERGAFSELNLGFEYGQRGTTNQNLIKENFFNFNVSLSLNARWFEKRKYN